MGWHRSRRAGICRWACRGTDTHKQVCACHPGAGAPSFAVCDVRLPLVVPGEGWGTDKNALVLHIPSPTLFEPRRGVSRKGGAPGLTFRPSQSGTLKSSKQDMQDIESQFLILSILLILFFSHRVVVQRTRYSQAGNIAVILFTATEYHRVRRIVILNVWDI